MAGQDSSAPSYWLLDTPVDLSAVDVELTSTSPPAVTGKQAETLPLRPLIAPGKHYDTYHRAMRDLNRPRLFENRMCYRLLDAQWSATGAKLSLGYMRYFDMIDVGEQLVHELALAEIDEHGNLKHEAPPWDRLPFRRLVRDPLDLQAYPLMLSVSTLTIRQSRAGLNLSHAAARHRQGRHSWRHAQRHAHWRIPARINHAERRPRRP